MATATTTDLPRIPSRAGAAALDRSSTPWSPPAVAPGADAREGEERLGHKHGGTPPELPGGDIPPGLEGRGLPPGLARAEAALASAGGGNVRRGISHGGLLRDAAGAPKSGEGIAGADSASAAAAEAVAQENVDALEYARSGADRAGIDVTDADVAAAEEDLAKLQQYVELWPADSLDLIMDSALGQLGPDATFSELVEWLVRFAGKFAGIKHGG